MTQSSKVQDQDVQISRWLVGLFCLISVVLCLAYAGYRSQLPYWWKMAGGGVPYVMFWVFLWAIVFPRRRHLVPVCLGVTLFTCLLEVLQLWKPAFLAEFKDSRFGAALLGREFSWEDFPPYFIGMIISYAVLMTAIKIWGRPVSDPETRVAEEL